MVVENIVNGSKTVLNLTKETLKSIKHPWNKKINFPETNYYLPTVYGILGKEITNIKELKELINSLSIEDKKEYDLDDALNSGVITLICAEALEVLKYVDNEQPYNPPYTGFIPDKILRDLGVPLVNGKIPAIFVVIGKVGDKDKLKQLITDIKSKNILTLFVGEIVKELEEANIELGLDQLLVPLGEEITSAIYGANLAVRAPLIYGGIEGGNPEEIINYIQNRVPAVVIALGPVDDITLAAGAGCIKAGVPVITNNKVPEIKGALESSDIDNIVENALKMKNITVEEMSITEIPVSVGPMNEGERVRGPDMFVELAGPKQFGFELVRVSDNASDKIEIIGKDIGEMEEGSKTPFAVIVKVSGDNLEEDLEGVLERRIHEIFNYIEGVMHLNQRDSVWIRINKESAEKGLNLTHIGKVIQDIYKAEFPFIKNVDVTLITDENKVKEELEKVGEIYHYRDEKTKNLKEEDVDVFYGCIMCQGFAPSHMCVITPDKPALCGGINYLDARAAAKIDPDGPIFAIEKGECIDDLKGIYPSVDEVLQDRTQGAIESATLHSALDRPSTSCGCFEAITFYIPEVDGFGIADRSFKGETPMGVPFSVLAGQCSGGHQVEGFCGISVSYMKSPKFFQADGGWNRVVWLPSELKNKVLEAIPEDMVPKIATEEDVSSIEELITFLKEKEHPVAENISADIEEGEEKEVVEEITETETVEEDVNLEDGTVAVPTMSLPAGFGGLPKDVKITLKNVIIQADEIIITRDNKK